MVHITNVVGDLPCGAGLSLGNMIADVYLFNMIADIHLFDFLWLGCLFLHIFLFSSYFVDTFKISMHLRLISLQRHLVQSVYAVGNFF